MKMSYHNYQGDDVIQQGKPAASDDFNNPPQEPLMLSPTLYAGARLIFVRKVYTILSIQLTITAIMTIIAMYSEGFKNLQLNNDWLLYTCFGFIIVSEIVILCFPAGRRPPINMICLAFFTLAQSYLVSFICSLTADNDGKYVVLMAALMTLGITLGATLYAIFTKTDFTIKWGIAVMLLCSLLFLGIFSIFYSDRFLLVLYCTLGIFLFGLYLIIDTQLILGGKRMQFSIDDYAAAAMLLYIDIIQIFLYILRMLKS